jgi:hypothetical protein
VWAKNFDNGTSHQDSFNPMADYAVSSQDIHQRFIISYIYAAPFGRGKTFGANMSRWEDAIVGGWQVNGITTLQGGTPLQISATNNLSTFNYQTLYADTNFQNAAYHGDIHQRLGKYFNTADFCQPGNDPNPSDTTSGFCKPGSSTNPFHLGNGPAYYNNLRSPGLNSTDLSLMKEFNPFEKLKVQFRTELFNAFNHVQFGSPDTGVNDATFGQITAQNNLPRQLQFGLKLMF